MNFDAIPEMNHGQLFSGAVLIALGAATIEYARDPLLSILTFAAVGMALVCDRVRIRREYEEAQNRALSALPLSGRADFLLHG